ncbi:hypothetical protein GCM10011594_12930 [Nakamurella endophytica]|uniref:Uncharacterized protein n=1 Tax=Nakamurella endophytica TaxID=1748367 RepID=A0A917STB3_9ACTN|nr:hypothetical protein GCM10011594_12930 [Nakamurella endophytica]
MLYALGFGGLGAGMWSTNAPRPGALRVASHVGAWVVTAFACGAVVTSVALVAAPRWRHRVVGTLPTGLRTATAGGVILGATTLLLWLTVLPTPGMAWLGGYPCMFLALWWDRVVARDRRRGSADP